MTKDTLSTSSLYYPVYIPFSPKKSVVCRGQIVSANIVKLSKTQFMIVDIVIHHNSFRRFAISSVSVGRSLYEYVNSNGRNDRMKDIDFEFMIEPTTQKVLSYIAYDANDYIPDVFEGTQRLY